MNDQHICPRTADERLMTPSAPPISETEHRLCAALAEHLDMGITPASRFDEMGLDSLDNIEILMIVEDEFGCAITDEEATKVVTVADAIALVDNKVGNPDTLTGDLGELVNVITEYLPILTRLEQSGEWDRFAAGTGIATVNRLRTIIERVKKG